MTAGRNVRRLYSPTIDLSSSNVPRVRFKYFYPTGGFQLNIIASSDGGATWQKIGSASPTGVANWQFAGAAIPGAYKVPNARIGLEAVNAWGSHDAWIDSLIVDEASFILSAVDSVGNWSNPNVWQGGQVPLPGDFVTILSGSKITIDVPVNVGNLSIADTLNFNTVATNTLTVSGNLIIAPTGRLNLFNGTTGRTLRVGRDFILNGTANFSRANAALIMDGTGPQTIAGSGTFTGLPVGVVRLLQITNPTTVTISTTNPFNISSTLNLANGTLNTNGLLSVDNTINDGVITGSCSTWSWKYYRRLDDWSSGNLQPNLHALYRNDACTSPFW